VTNGAADPNAEAILDAFSRHIISICIHYQLTGMDSPEAPLRVQCYPGVLLYYRGTVVLLTAGHALESLDEALRDGSASIESARIIDSFGSTSSYRESIPFDYPNSMRRHINDEQAGVDFGLVEIGSVYLPLLQTQGIQALPESGWADFDSDRFEYYYLVGIPEERVVVHGNRAEKVSLTLALIGLSETDPPPESVKTYPRLSARVNNKGGLRSLRGMSGGPIYGVIQGERPEYRLAAIQSSWLRSRGIVFGCRIDVIKGIIDQQLEGLP